MISSAALHKFQDYIDGVMDGSIVVSIAVRAAVERHIKDLSRQGDADFPFVFDAKKARSVIEFFPVMCRHSIGEFTGVPFDLEPWQAFIIGSLFGWKRLDGSRRFRKAYVSVGRKNGKSTMIAGLIHYLAMADINPNTGKPEAVAEIILTATKRDQANIVFDEASRMRLQSPEIKAMSDTKYHKINYTHNQSTIKTSSSDRPLSGLNPHAVAMDELHEWKDQHRKFYDTMVTGFASRLQPLHIIITTAGDDQSALWLEEYEYAIKAVKGELTDNQLFVYAAELDPDDDPFDEANWIKANPNLGVSCKLAYLRDQANKESQTPSGRNRFTRYHGNRKVSSVEKAFDIHKWDRCKGVFSDWSNADCVCYAGDLGGRDDLAAYAACARLTLGYETVTIEDRTEDRPLYRFEVRAQSYISDDTLRDLSKQPFQDWIYRGLIHKTQYTTSQLRSDLIKDMEAHNATIFGYDKYNAQQLAEELKQEGFEPIQFAQNGAHFNEPMREFMILLGRGQVVHDGNEVLRWAANNMSITRNAQDQWMPDKRSSKDKIDPIVAVLMAFRLAALQPAVTTGSKFVY